MRADEILAGNELPDNFLETNSSAISGAKSLDTAEGQIPDEISSGEEDNQRLDSNDMIPEKSLYAENARRSISVSISSVDTGSESIDEESPLKEDHSAAMQ